MRWPEAIELAQGPFGDVLTPLSGDFVASESVSPHSELMFLEETYVNPHRNRPFAGMVASVRRAPSVYALSVGMFAVLAFALILSRHNKSPSSNGLTIGIVPFETYGAQAGQIEQSFRMDLSDTLSELPALQVYASHSLGNVKKDDASLQTIAKALNLDLLLLGWFTIKDNHCVLRLELVRGRDAAHLASFQYTGSQQEMAVIRDKAQRDIYSGLQLTGGLGAANRRQHAESGSLLRLSAGERVGLCWNDNSAERCSCAIQERDSVRPHVRPRLRGHGVCLPGDGWRSRPCGQFGPREADGRKGGTH